MPGRVKRNFPRINIAFYDDHLDFLRYVSLKNHLSITQFVNKLVAQEMARYDRADWAPEPGKCPSLDSLISSAEYKRDSQTQDSSVIRAHHLPEKEEFSL